MKQDKQFYKDLGTVNGFKWSFFDKGLHSFIRRDPVSGMYAECKVNESDIESGDYVWMLENNLTRK